MLITEFATWVKYDLAVTIIHSSKPSSPPPDDDGPSLTIAQARAQETGIGLMKVVSQYMKKLQFVAELLRE